MKATYFILLFKSELCIVILTYFDIKMHRKVPRKKWLLKMRVLIVAFGLMFCTPLYDIQKYRIEFIQFNSMILTLLMCLFHKSCSTKILHLLWFYVLLMVD